MATPRRVHTLSLKTKCDIIREIEQGKRNSVVAQEYGIPRNTVSTFVRNKEKILSTIESSYDPTRKRIRTSDFSRIEEATLMWYRSERERCVPVTGPMIKSKAKEFAFELQQPDFKASNGWLARFKLRHSIDLKGSNKIVPSPFSASVEKWKEDFIRPALENYKISDVFYCDETGLFFRTMPDESTTFQGLKCSSGERCEDRLTVLLAANMAGSEKVKPLVIGKSKNPKCFKGVKCLPVDYKSSLKAWMTPEIFEQWLRKLDYEFYRENRKILLFLARSRSHPEIGDLSAVTLCYLPPNSNPISRVLHRGIIHRTKVLYRKRLIQKFTDTDGKIADRKVSILDAVEMLDSAWGLISGDEIQRSFQHSGFNWDLQTDDLPRRSESGGQTASELEKYSEVDDHLATSGELDESEILESVKRNTFLNLVEHGCTELSETSDDECEVAAPSRHDALKAVEVVRQFLRTQEKAGKLIQKLNKIDNFLFSLGCEKQMEVEGYSQNAAASKEEPHPLEPTVVIKEEPIEFEPTPSTSAEPDCIIKDEFILPHEENAWTSTDSLSSSGVDPSGRTTFSVACLGTDQDKTPSTNPVLGETRKRKANPSKLSVPGPSQKVARTSLEPGIVPTECLPSPSGNAGDSSNPSSLNESRVSDRSHDQFDAFGEYIAAKLRSLDKRACAFAQKAIGDIIFDAEMGKFAESMD